MKVIDKVSIKYIEIVKLFSVAISTLALAAAIYVFMQAITWPKHPEFKPGFLGAQLPYASEIIDDKDFSASVITANTCVSAETLQDIDKRTGISLSKHQVDNAWVEFSNELKKIDDTKGYEFESELGCYQSIAKNNGVSDNLVPLWLEYHKAWVATFPKDAHYYFASLFDYSSKRFIKEYKENQYAQKDFSFNYVLGSVSLALFLLFVMSCCLLILVKIENNTRR